MRWIAIACFVLTIIALLTAPALIVRTLLVCAGTLVLVMATLRIFAVVLALLPTKPMPVITPKTWPRFTILVPLYDEAHMVSALMRSLAKLDYPVDRLDIVIVCEADDIPTCHAVERRLRPPFRIYKVPPSYPRTKPKALNAAMTSLSTPIKGDIITIYDAEDRPHPGQLKQAARAFASDPQLAAVQAPLGYYNDRNNLLSALFGLEYAALFHIWNPALARLGLPFTLGGTSNHIRRDVLHAAGGWDPYNVTEDADLSFRISAMSRPGHPLKIGCIGLGTEEEAVDTHQDWTDQRVRWLKGFMQVWSVHMRPKPTAPDGKVFCTSSRIKNTTSLQLTVGATLFAAFLHVPSLLVIAGLFLARQFGFLDFTWPAPFYIILLIGYGSAILMGIVGAIKAKKYYLILIAPLMPFYWLLYFRPALLAAHEFITAPAHWRKTRHKGLNSDISTATSPRRLEPVKDRLI